MNQVDHDRNPRPVRGVHQPLELLGCPETRAGGEEIGHLIAERAVVRVLLDGHELNGVVTRRGDAGEDAIGELLPGADLFLLLRHAGVDFVDQRGGILAAVVRMPPAIGLRRVPDLGVEDQRRAVLDHAARPGRDAVARSARPVHPQAVVLVVLQPIPRQPQFPDARLAPADELEFRQRLPVRGIADQKNPFGVRGPLAQDPLVPVQVQAEVLVARGEVGERDAAAGQARFGRGHAHQSPLDRLGIGREQGVAGDDALHAGVGHRRLGPARGGISRPAAGGCAGDRHVSPRRVGAAASSRTDRCTAAPSVRR